MSNTNTFTLKEIANKKNSNNIEIVIPSLQRGLVWKPNQIEFLWDSILRFFPIGGFVIAKNHDGKYDLMDGQQRFNAIMLGFREPSEQDDIILWLDINPIKESNTTRKFFIKATTKSHPWGYKNDENCSLLSAEERRLALNEFFGSVKNIYNDNSINLCQTYPYSYKKGEGGKSQNFPIPFSYFLNGELSKGWKDYFDSIISKVEDKNNKLLKWKKTYWKEENINLLKTFVERNFHIFKSVLYSEEAKNVIERVYRVPFSELPENTIEEESNSDNNMTELELLFERLNTGGTRIVQEDLAYSAIKAYWGSINIINDEIAKGFIPPQKLVMLLFRLIITLDNLKNNKQKKFESNLSIKRIREIAKNEQDACVKEHIEEFYKNKAISIVDKLKECYKQIPSYIVMFIVKDKPDIILLGLFFAEKGLLDQIKFCGLSLLLYWFCYNPYQALNLILEEIYDANSENINYRIKAGIKKSFEANLFSKIYNEQEIRAAIFNNDILSNSKETLNETEEYWFISTVFYNKTFLLYAQKDFLNDHFKYYNPADTISWEDHNRPWDYDHIIPRAWSYGHYRTDAKLLVDEWLNTIGNFAAIPFEDNRSKNKYSDFTYYNKNSDALLFDKRFETEIKETVAQDLNMAIKFKNLVFNRILKIYAKCYDSFKELIPDASMINSEAKESDEELFTQFLELIIQEIKTQYNTENTHIEYALYNQQFEELNSTEAAKRFLEFDSKAKVIDISTPLEDESKRVDIEFIIDKNQFTIQGGLRNPNWIQEQLFSREKINKIDFVNKNQGYQEFKNANLEKRKEIVKIFLNSCDKLSHLLSN